jgi:hypothetical protein
LDDLPADRQAGRAITAILLKPVIFIRLIYTDSKIDAKMERRRNERGDGLAGHTEFPRWSVRPQSKSFPSHSSPAFARQTPDGPIQGWLFVDTTRCSASGMGIRRRRK